jgi:arginase
MMSLAPASLPIPTIRLQALATSLAIRSSAPNARRYSPPPFPGRGSSGFLNERALLEMVTSVYDRVRASLAARHFPLIYGADCAVLLGAVPALRDVYGSAALVFIDGHEDATPMDLSASGEAASMGIALLLGIDLDVLNRTEFSACGAAGEMALPGGLRTPLTRAERTAADPP